MNKEYVYVAMVSGYESWKVLGVFDDYKEALKRANHYLKKHNHETGYDYADAYAHKVIMNGKVIGTYNHKEEYFKEV